MAINLINLSKIQIDPVGTYLEDYISKSAPNLDFFALGSPKPTPKKLKKLKKCVFWVLLLYFVRKVLYFVKSNQIKSIKSNEIKSNQMKSKHMT